MNRPNNSLPHLASSLLPLQISMVHWQLAKPVLHWYVLFTYQLGTGVEYFHTSLVLVLDQS
jgi:hypothetical protein